MSELYTITLEDQVTGNAYRIAKAYTDVSIAAQYLARSVKTADADMQALDRNQLRLARTELMAARAAQTAGNAIAKLGPKMGSATASSKALTSAHARGTQGAFRFSYALNALANQAMNTAFALARNLAGAALDAGKSLYDTADLATRAHQSFANFFGGQVKGDQTLRESIDIAKRYGFSIDDVVGSMNRFGAAGFTKKQSEGLLEFGADMMAAGRSVQDVKGIFLAMTQIQGKGKLQAEELTQQLAERGINAGRVWEILAKKFKTTKELVMKMQKAGKIKPGAALNAIVQAGVEGVNGHKLGEAGAKVADATVGGLGRRMNTLIESTIFDAVDHATPALTKGMQALFGGMNAANVSGLQDNLTKMLEGVGGFLEKVGPKMPAIAANFEKAFGSSAGFKIDSWNQFADSLPEMAKNLGAIAGSLTKIAAIASTLVTGTADKSHGSFWEFMTTPMNQQGQFWADKLSGNGTGTGLVSEGSATNVNNMAFDKKSREAADKAIDGLNYGVEKGAHIPVDAMQNTAVDMINAFSGPQGTDAHSPSKKFMRQGQYIAEGLALGVDSNADLAMHSTRMMADSAMAAGAGASGLDPRRATAAGSAAGSAMSSRSSALTVRVGDVVLGGGGSGHGSDADAVRDYFETDFVSMLERHLEGVGA